MDYECSICLEKYKKGDVVKELECQHYFHESCIMRWAETSGNCPFCRCYFREEDEEDEANQQAISDELLARVDLLRNFVNGEVDQQAQEQEAQDQAADFSEDNDYIDEDDYYNENYDDFDYDQQNDDDNNDNGDNLNQNDSQ